MAAEESSRRRTRQRRCRIDAAAVEERGGQTLQPYTPEKQLASRVTETKLVCLHRVQTGLLCAAWFWILSEALGIDGLTETQFTSANDFYFTASDGIKYLWNSVSQMHQTDANKCNLFFCSLLTKKTSDKRHYFAVTSSWDLDQCTYLEGAHLL